MQLSASPHLCRTGGALISSLAQYLIEALWKEQVNMWPTPTPPTPPVRQRHNGQRCVRLRRKSAAADIHSNQILTCSFINDGEEADLVREAAKKQSFVPACIIQK